jgi:hypothetical protein
MKHERGGGGAHAHAFMRSGPAWPRISGGRDVTSSQRLDDLDEWLPLRNHGLLTGALSALSDSASPEFAEALQDIDRPAANGSPQPQSTFDWLLPVCSQCWRRYPRYARAWHDAHPRHLTDWHERLARRVEREIWPLRRRIRIRRRNDCTDVDALQAQLDALLAEAKYHRDVAAAARALPDPPVPTFQALAQAAQAAADLVDDDPWRVADGTSGAAGPGDVASVIQDRIRPVIDQCVANVLGYLGVHGGEGHLTPRGVAAALKTPVRTLSDRLRRADVPALEILIGWHRLLHAVWRVERESRGLPDVVSAGGYSSGEAFQKAIKRYSGRGFAELMNSGQPFRCLLEQFARTLEGRQHVERAS